MKRFNAIFLTMLVGTLASSQSAFAAAFQLYEIGAPIVGTAGVGQAAITEDASAAYFNPAGMVFAPGTQFMLGAQTIAGDIQFDPNSHTTISGDDGGNASTVLPGMDLFFSYHFSPDIKFGLSVTAPYGGSLTYDDGWVGRYVVQNAFFFVINANPSIAYRFNEWISGAAGVSLEYMSLQQTTAIPILNQVDGQINIKVDNYAPGFNAGLMFSPNRSTRIGVAYRSQITHNLKGNLTFLRVAPMPNVTTKMVMPQNVIASLSQDLSDRATLLAEVGWANWSTMQDTALDLRNISAIIPRNWKNTYRFGLGGQFKIRPDLIWQAGVSYDSSPTNAHYRLPDLPMDQQIRVGTGLSYAMLRPVHIAFSYEYINFGPANIDNSSATGVLAGEYSRNYASTVQVSINVCS